MIRVRIPPSPTGRLHIGTARTALFNYLFAKKNGGNCVLRMEDTDKERSTNEFEKDIIDGLVKLGIAGDEGVHAGGDFGPYRQSERTDIYQKYLVELLEADKAYFCFCSKDRLNEMREKQMQNKQPTRYDRTCAELDPIESKNRAQAETATIRLRIPGDQDVSWNDLIRGETTIHSRELDDFIIARRIDDPLYHLTVVADDHDMKITHVIRGEDHISNTPKQILLFQAFGWEIPEFGHMPLILNEDKTKMSKRKNKVSVDDYLNDGFLIEALLNYLALLGWNTSDEQEIFSLQELEEKFSLEAVHKGGAVFDLKRLEWMNSEYIKREIEADVDAFFEKAKPQLADLPDKPELIKSMLTHPDFAGRFTKISDIPGALSPFFSELPSYEKELLLKEKFGITADMAGQVFGEAIRIVEDLDWEIGETEKGQEISDALVTIVADLGLKNGQVLWPIRVALSGLEKSANFATLAVYLGKQEVIDRLQKAKELIE